MEPTLLTQVNLEMLVMQEEIFGPLLPIITFEKNNEVIDQLQKLPSPLAIYIMSKRKQIFNTF